MLMHLRTLVTGSAASLLAAALLGASAYAQVGSEPLVPFNRVAPAKAAPKPLHSSVPKPSKTATVAPSAMPSPAPSRSPRALPKPTLKPILKPTAKPVEKTLLRPIAKPVVKPQSSNAVKPVLPQIAPSAKPATAASNSAEEPCYRLFKRIPGVSRNLCAQSALRESGRHSVLGKPLLVRDLPAPAGIAKPTRVLVIGAIHGDELSSVTLALNWLQLAQEIPANAHWHFIPGLNPDGILAKKPTRFNAHGVDLNRNFPTPDWERDARKYWEVKTKKDPRRWPGNAPLSEPESKYLMEVMAQFKPNLIVSIHAPYGMLDFDGPTIPPEKLGRLYLDQIGIYPGSLGNYAGIHRGMPVVTIELKHATQAPNAAETRQMWLDLVRWMSARGL